MYRRRTFVLITSFRELKWILKENGVEERDRERERDRDREKVWKEFLFHIRKKKISMKKKLNYERLIF